MTAHSLFAKLYCAGFDVTVIGDKLKVVAPVGATIPDELGAQIRAYKPELLKILAAGAKASQSVVTTSGPRPDFAALERCRDLDRMIVDYASMAPVTDEVRDLMLSARKRMSPRAVVEELKVMACRVAQLRKRAR